jgi:hypothetical protein
VAGAAVQRPADEELQAITEAGRRIASYHEAVVKGRALFESRAELTGDKVRQVVVDRKGEWHVVSLRRVSQGEGPQGWVMVGDCVFHLRAGEADRLQLFEPPKAAPADALAMVRAIEAARAGAPAHLAAAPPPFDEAVFRDRTGGLSVYLQSRAEARGGARFGSDLRARTAADGTQVMEIVPLHGPGEAVVVPPGDGRSPTLHSHAKGDLPTETDVALVLANPRVAPHLVLTPLWMFRIEADGAVAFLGRNEVPPVASGGGP